MPLREVAQRTKDDPLEFDEVGFQKEWDHQVKFVAVEAFDQFLEACFVGQGLASVVEHSYGDSPNYPVRRWENGETEEDFNKRINEYYDNCREWEETLEGFKKDPDLHRGYALAVVTRVLELLLEGKRHVEFTDC
jgi:hypothetical protein